MPDLLVQVIDQLHNPSLNYDTLVKEAIRVRQNPREKARMIDLLQMSKDWNEEQLDMMVEEAVDLILKIYKYQEKWAK